MINDIYNSITGMIKRAVLTLAGKDANKYQTSQVSYLGKTADTEIIYPYGLCGNPPLGSLVLLFNVQGMEENRAGIANLPSKRFNGLKEGEVAVGNYLTGSYVKFLEDGNIEIVASGGSINVTGNIVVNGDVIANGVSLTTHVHSGVTPGSSNTGEPV